MLYALVTNSDWLIDSLLLVSSAVAIQISVISWSLQVMDTKTRLVSYIDLYKLKITSVCGSVVRVVAARQSGHLIENSSSLNSAAE